MSPRRNSVQAMAQHDALPPEWRALVCDYNLSAVMDARRRGWSLARTRAHLEAERARLQFRRIDPYKDRRGRKSGRIPAVLDSLNQFLASREATP